METMIELLVKSAFVAAGQVVTPGARVRVRRTDAASLVARGKAVAVAGGDGPDTGGDEASSAPGVDQQASESSAPAKPARRRR